MGESQIDKEGTEELAFPNEKKAYLSTEERT
jgi:hypothetical protein